MATTKKGIAIEKFLCEPRTTEELKEMTTHLIEVVQDAQTIERIWFSAVFFTIYGVVGEDGRAVLAENTAHPLMDELLK